MFGVKTTTAIINSTRREKSDFSTNVNDLPAPRCDCNLIEAIDTIIPSPSFFGEIFLQTKTKLHSKFVVSIIMEFALN
jgi:hypothetical protein